MIVLDEQLADQRIIEDIDSWYAGSVVVVTSLVPPYRVVKDEAVPTLLRGHRGCAFVTINNRGQRCGHVFQLGDDSIRYYRYVAQRPYEEILLEEGQK